MTLLRTALRLCAAAAVKGVVGHRPTIAGERVYDSRLSDISPEAFVDDAMPTIIVLTDNDEGNALSEQNGGPPFERNIDLMLEIGMTAAELIEGNEYQVGYPSTDARLEASLDLLEFQIVRLLAEDMQSPLAEVFRRFWSISQYDCHRQVDDSAGVKLACRVLTLRCTSQDRSSHVVLAGAAAPVGLEALPEPLRTVARALPAGSAGLDICQTIAAAIAPLTAGPFEGFDARVDAGDAVVTTEPDDREVVMTIDLPQL